MCTHTTRHSRRIFVPIVTTSTFSVFLPYSNIDAHDDGVLWIVTHMLFDQLHVLSLDYLFQGICKHFSQAAVWPHNVKEHLAGPHTERRHGIQALHQLVLQFCDERQKQVIVCNYSPDICCVCLKCRCPLVQCCQCGVQSVI
ncbi:hypothetical protein ORF072R [Spotted knifejaw iridovirus]|nr:hypothetical protein ORF072R [Spotted knifejaw iridovirus]